MKFRLVEEQQYGKKSKKQFPTFSHADLLTAEEAEKLPQRLSKYKEDWWLQTIEDGWFGSGECAKIMDTLGFIDMNYVANDGAVRPALRITNLNDYEVGKMFRFGGQWFQIIDEHTAFCVGDIGKRRFSDGSSIHYEKSEIKQFIDDWFNKYNRG